MVILIPRKDSALFGLSVIWWSLNLGKGDTPRIIKIHKIVSSNFFNANINKTCGTQNIWLWTWTFSLYFSWLFCIWYGDKLLAPIRCSGFVSKTCARFFWKSPSKTPSFFLVTSHKRANKNRTIMCLVCSYFYQMRCTLNFPNPVQPLAQWVISLVKGGKKLGLTLAHEGKERMFEKFQKIQSMSPFFSKRQTHREESSCFCFIKRFFFWMTTMIQWFANLLWVDLYIAELSKTPPGFAALFQDTLKVNAILPGAVLDFNNANPDKAKKGLAGFGVWR